MLKSFFKLVFIVFSPVLVMIAGMILSFIIQFTYLRFKGYKLKGSIPKVKKDGILKKLLIQFPNRLAKDIYTRDPVEFREYGLHLFCGEQGSGKTTAAVELIQRWRKRYPLLKVVSNMDLKGEDKRLTHWKDILDYNNDIYGTAVVIDEIQTWFSSNESRNFPPEMITEISQQRKQRKAIIGTAQVFSRVAKPIREQATYIYLPMTLFGCLTIVRKTKREYWDDQKQRFRQYCGIYFFVHTDEIRNAFDTYKKIERYKNTGFTRPTWLSEHELSG